jgi:hypothetical protein
MLMAAREAGGARRCRIHRLAVPGLILALGLASCAAPPARRVDVPEFGEIKVSFAVGQDVQVINVRALDRLPITSAVLELPTGERVPAYSIDRQTDPSFSNQITLGAPTSDVVNVGGAVPFLAGPGLPQVTTRLIGQIASVGLIRIPDLAAYREQWPKSRILVHMGLAPDDREEALAAPQPG